MCKANITLKSKDELFSLYRTIHELLRNREGLSPEKSKLAFGQLLTLILLEEHIKMGKIGNRECMYSDLHKVSDDEVLLSRYKMMLMNLYRDPQMEKFRNPVMIKHASTFRKLVDLLKCIDMKTIDDDLRGMLYELFIGNSAYVAEMGQYFTDRAICNLMVEREKIQPGETVLDPTCGSGGFLISAHKACPDALIYGYDTDKDLVTASHLNMLCVSGKFTDKIERRDTLRQPINQQFDCILANPPYGTGDKKMDARYKDASSTIKQIGVDANVKELLFLQLMMAALKPGGRCSVVLPDGVLFNVNKKYVELRKRLVQGFRVEEVIDIPANAFINTSTKTSILRFSKPSDKKPETTTRVIFSRITGEVICHATAEQIGIKRGSKYPLNYQMYIPWKVSGSQDKTVQDVADFDPERYRPQDPDQTLNYIDIGSVHVGDLICRKIMRAGDRPSRASRLVKPGDILISRVRPNLKNYIHITERLYESLKESCQDVVCSTGFTIVRPKEAVSSHYLYNQLSSDRVTDGLALRAFGTEYPEVRLVSIANIPIECPDLSIQQAWYREKRIEETYRQYKEIMETFKELGVDPTKTS